MELGLKGKVAVVTGGTSGIGKAIVLTLLGEGCRVGTCGLTQEHLEDLRGECRENGFSEGEHFLASIVDVRDDTAVEAFSDAVVAKWGRIDIWINQAGASNFRSLCSYTTEALFEELRLHIGACFNGCRAAASKMKRQGGGVILNVSSQKAFTPSAGRGVYSMGKAAVVSLTKTLAAELAADHIRVVGYAPGTILTRQSAKTLERYGPAYVDQIPLHRLGTVEEVAALVAFLASERASYLTGTTIQINGGKGCVQNPSYAYNEA